MCEQKLYNFLSSLPQAEFVNELDFLSKAVPELLSLLGYQQSQVFFQAILSPQLRRSVDAIVASDRVARPWILLETKLNHKSVRWNWERVIVEWEDQLKFYREHSNPEYFIFFTPSMFIIYHHEHKFTYNLPKVTFVQVQEIYSTLKSPNDLPKSQSPFVATSNQVVHKDADTFHIDMVRYSTLWAESKTATTNNYKGKSLESLASFIFEGMPFFYVKYRNLRTSSSELDLVIQYNGWKNPNIFDEFGRYILVECKNWEVPVAAKQIRDFTGKMRKSRIKLGILFAKNGITGVNNSVDALREIHAAFDQDNLYVVIVSEEDLEGIHNGGNFYDILDTKVDELRFDL